MIGRRHAWRLINLAIKHSMSLGEGIKRRLGTVSVVLVASVVTASMFIIGFGREYLRNLEIEREIAGLQAENDRLGGKKLEFMSLIHDLSSEYYLEEQARVKEGLAKPGETLVLVDDGEQTAAPTGKVLGTATEAEGISNPTSWLYFFFDHEHFVQLLSDL